MATRQWSDDEVFALAEAAYLVGATSGRSEMPLGVRAERYMSELEHALVIKSSHAARRRVLTQAGAIQQRVVRKLLSLSCDGQR